eukprot:sb/3465844/
MHTVHCTDGPRFSGILIAVSLNRGPTVITKLYNKEHNLDDHRPVAAQQIAYFPPPNSVDDYIRVNISDGGPPITEVTIAAWVKHSNGSVFLAELNTECGGVIPFLGEWIHYVATWASATGEIKMYLNGDLVKEVTIIRTKLQSGLGNEGLLILGQVDLGPRQLRNAFSGKITGLFWLRKVLTPDQVSTLYKDTLVDRDSASYPPEDIVLSWSGILTTGKFHGGTYKYHSFSALSFALEVLPMTQKFQFNDLKLFHKIFYETSPINLPSFLQKYNPELHDRRATRQQTKRDSTDIICTEQPRVDLFKNCYFYRCHLEWNLLPKELRNTAEHHLFSSKLKDHLWNSLHDTTTQKPLVLFIVSNALPTLPIH